MIGSVVVDENKSDLEKRIGRLERWLDNFTGVRNTTAYPAPEREPEERRIRSFPVAEAGRQQKRRLMELEELLDRMGGAVAEANVLAERYRRRYQKKKRNEE